MACVIQNRGVAMLGEVLHEHVAGQRRAQHRSMCDVPLV